MNAGFCRYVFLNALIRLSHDINELPPHSSLRNLQESAQLLQSHLLSGAELIQRDGQTGKGIEMVFGRDYSGVSDTQLQLEPEEEITLGLSRQTDAGIYASAESEEGRESSTQYDDSVVLSSSISDDYSSVTYSQTGGGEEEEIQAALERAGQIRGC